MGAKLERIGSMRNVASMVEFSSVILLMLSADIRGSEPKYVDYRIKDFWLVRDEQIIRVQLASGLNEEIYDMPLERFEQIILKSNFIKEGNNKLLIFGYGGENGFAQYDNMKDDNNKDTIKV